MSLVEKLFGSFSDRELKKVNPITKQVLALEPKYQALSDADLQAQTAVFKQQLAEGKTLDDILPDAFAVCREAAWRVLGMKHFPVQVTGGIALHRGAIAEMQTGEGKTLVATLPAYLNALTGEGVHIVTVNDYLAKRDSEWMGKLYRWLGLSVGLIVQGIDGDSRRRAYNADITYGTNNEFGFDYLRDNMVTYKDNMVQRGHAYAIVDEVDSILIDEARTPLIISGRGEDSSSLYTQVDRFVRTLRKSVVVELEDKVETDEQTDGDYVVDEKHKTCTLTASGIKKAEEYFKIENLAATENIVRALVKAGAMANSSCGIHVHVDGANHTPESLTRLLNLATGRQDLFYEALQIGDRANRWCHKISPELFRAMKEGGKTSRDAAESVWYSTANDGYNGSISHEHYNSTRYHGINLHAYFSKGTVEFRLFNGTTHAGKIKAYIQFCLAMSGWAIESNDNRKFFKDCSGYTQEQKAALMTRVLVNRLGMSGPEFKTARLHLTAAFRQTAQQAA